MGVTELIGWAVFGLFIGLVARLLWPGPQRAGCLTTMLLGIIGSIVGGMITHLLTGGEYEPSSYLMSILGAILVLWIAGRVSRGDSY
jgi:uncharacterized membrane protein YeaQ/YmgE (transglycosylase-associated protein family)